MLLSSFDLFERRTHGDVPAGEVDNDWRRVTKRVACARRHGAIACGPGPTPGCRYRAG